MAECAFAGCTEDVVIQWQRECTEAEIAEFVASGDLPAGTTEATKPVFACDVHQLKTPEGEPNLQLMAVTHFSDCAAPPACTCDVVVVSPADGKV